MFEYPVVISHSPAWWIMVILLLVLQVRLLAIEIGTPAIYFIPGNAHLLVPFDLSNDKVTVVRTCNGRGH